MKNLIVICGILIVIMTLANCSSNNDSNSAENALVGTWKPIKEVDVCSTGSQVSSQYSTCQQQSRYTFNENGTFSIIDYQMENIDCIIAYQATGTWLLSNGNLTIIAAGVTETPTFFELTNNMLQIGYYDADPNDPCDGGNLPSHYYTEFSRVQ